MNYQRIYDELIANAVARNWTKKSGTEASGYVERHHIVPRSHGGSDDVSNLVYLTYDEHIESHRLLFLIHRDSSMALAYKRMCDVSGRSSEDLAEAKRIASEAAGNRFKTLFDDPVFAESNRERSSETMKKLHADPEFAERHRVRSKARMERLHSDPKFSKANRKLGSEAMKKLHADPAFAERHLDRLKNLHADPAFAEQHSKRMSKFMISSQTRPWCNFCVKNDPALLELWTMLDKIYQWYQETGKGYTRCAKHFGYKETTTWQNMLKYVRTHGDPRQDPEWVSFKVEQNALSL